MSSLGEDSVVGGEDRSEESCQDEEEVEERRAALGGVHLRMVVGNNTRHTFLTHSFSVKS